MNELMSKRDPWSFNWLALSGLLVLVPHTTRIPAWLSLVFVATMAWQWVSIQRGWRLPGKLVRLVFTAVLLVGVFKEFGTLLGRDAGTGLLVGLAGLKFLELRTLRDYMITTFVFYLLIGVDFLHDQELVHGAYLVATVFTTTATLVRLNLPSSDDWRYSLRLAGGMLLRALPLMLVMYLLFPRIQGGLWSLPADAQSGTTGLSSQISAGSISRLVESEAPAFRVEFDSELPAPAQRYWRAIVLWQTDGKTWKPGGTPYIDSAKQKIRTLGHPVRYTITLEPSGKRWRPVLDLPMSADNDSRERMGHLIEARARQYQRVRYTAMSYPEYNTGNLNAYERRLGLQLPAGISARTRQLVDTWQRKADSKPQIIAQAMLHFGGQNFRYTLKPPRLGDDPVDEFLFDSQAGFCEHYATTFVTLMRLAGIPSRVVVGYQGGEMNEGSNYLIVRQSDAHAWAEVWLEGRGWVRADPTAAIAPERIELGSNAIRRLEERGIRPGSLGKEALTNIVELGFLESLWRRSYQAWDAVNLAWFRWTTGYDIDKQLQLLKSLGMEAPGWLGLIIGLTAGVSLFLLAMLLGLKRSERDREPLLSIYRLFENKLAKAGLNRRPSEGPVDFARRAGQLQPALRSVIDDITGEYVELRYHQSPADEPADPGELRKRVRAFNPKKLLADTEA